MKLQVYSANEWLYPDQSITDSSEPRISLISARGSFASCQILMNALPEQSELVFTFQSEQPDSHSNQAGLAFFAFQLLDVQVNENTDVDVSTIPVGTSAPSYVTRQAPFRVYDALIPVHGSSMPPAPTAAYYLRWDIPEHVSAGAYHGQLTIRVNEHAYAVPVHLEVSAARVPSKGHLQITNWYSICNIADRHGLELWSEPFWSMLEQYLKAMRRCRQTHVMVDHAFVDIEKQADGGYHFDFTKAERLVALCLELGFTHIEGGHVGKRINWEDPTFVLSSDPSIQATSKEGYEFISRYLAAWRSWLDQKDWLPLLVQHVADEPIEPSAADYRILTGIVRKCLPGVPLIDAVINTSVAGAVDIWVPTNKEYELNRQAYEDYRKLGDMLWFYTCWNPGGEYLNRFLDFPLLKTRYLHWGNYKYNLAGYLHWGFNYYFKDQDPFELTNPLLAPHVHNRRVPAGDTHLVYPGPDGPLLSMRLEAMRAGVEDYELLRSLGKHHPELAQDIAASCMTSFKEVNTNPEAFDAAYRRLLESVSAYPE
ncbi:DUF4091 domain-containing protein [Paenibacillus aquistagni]|uniref:DUF4091 domain-containing protein n=1 Tax=Paenibacillus aquistagni TaxID=1852522 RepID=UPI00145BFAD7|nr:DUF4091 domain-containing protein [Paenibacillus aquistagni]NMM51316.1 DUF4091 domain-containing protein [Paenibacillus aquistagni]